MHRTVKLIWLAGVALLAMVGLMRAPAPEWRFAIDPPPQSQRAEPYFETVFDYVSPAGAAHSPALLRGGGARGVRLIWFDGSGEAAEDVRILGADPFGGNKIEEILTTDSLAKAFVPGQMVRVLGNTIQAHPGAKDFLATVVSLGGWAAASVAHVEIGPDGMPLAARKLSLSPFLGRSHLVRAPVVRFEGGDIGLPAYFEMGNAFGVFARLRPDGRVVSVAQMGGPIPAIQPMIVPLSPHKAVAVMRNFSPGGGPLLASWTEDGGQSWLPPAPLDLPNPNAPVAVLRLSSGDLLMAYNGAADHAKSLDLALSGDGGATWRFLAQMADGTEGPLPGSVRYPAMDFAADGAILLTYSYGNKKGIRAVAFNEAWVAQQ